MKVQRQEANYKVWKGCLVLWALSSRAIIQTTFILLSWIILKNHYFKDTKNSSLPKNPSSRVKVVKRKSKPGFCFTDISYFSWNKNSILKITFVLNNILSALQKPYTIPDKTHANKTWF